MQELHIMLVDSGAKTRSRRLQRPCNDPAQNAHFLPRHDYDGRFDNPCSILAVWNFMARLQSTAFYNRQSDSAYFLPFTVGL